MKTLDEIYQSYCVKEDTGSGDKGTVHSYIPVYEEMLKPYREKECVFMEIGIARGLSMRMWREYFTKAIVIGSDKAVVCGPIPGVELFEGDSTNPQFAASLPLNFDVIVEDGSHVPQDQIATFKAFKPRMNHGGIYVIEDVPNLEMFLEQYKRLHDNMRIFDMRHQKGRFDDVLLVYLF